MTQKNLQDDRDFSNLIGSTGNSEKKTWMKYEINDL